MIKENKSTAEYYHSQLFKETYAFTFFQENLCIMATNGKTLDHS